MYDLFTRTLSQGLQAFLPIAFGVLWFRRSGDADAVTGLRWGVLAALPATAGAAYWFQASSRQAQWEAGLAMAALALAIWFARKVVWQSRLPTSHVSVEPRGRQVFRIACAAAAALIVVRQTMEVAIVLTAALQMRSLDALLAITGGAALSVVVTALWLSIGRRLPDSAFSTATRVFSVLFVGQLGMYAFHESAEARLLPWSDVLHAATEPYGPDGIYGRYVSVLLFVVPLAAAAAALVKARIPRRLLGNRRLWIVRVPQAAVGVVVLVASSIVLMSAIRNDRIPSYAATSPALPARSAAAIAAAPHLLFRHTAIDQNYSRLGITPLDARNPSDRAAAEFTCERVSYAAGHGICLQADRGVFTTYKAVFFDRTLKASRSFKLAGSPSRTRVSSDGRVGAITVFVTGQAHGYAGGAFSTKTTILDMAGGDELGDLEQFTTWRDGARFKNADFNFWGVTFARDSNVFYATLKTSAANLKGMTYLVQGRPRAS